MYFWIKKTVGEVQEPGGRFTVELAGQRLQIFRGYPGYVEFEVWDNGIGVDQETCERAFTLFFSSKTGDGTGLGLFVSNKIAQADGGEIRLESELHQGSRVIVKIPRRKPVPKAA